FHASQPATPARATKVSGPIFSQPVTLPQRAILDHADHRIDRPGSQVAADLPGQPAAEEAAAAVAIDRKPHFRAVPLAQYGANLAQPVDQAVVLRLRREPERTGEKLAVLIA